MHVGWGSHHDDDDDDDDLRLPGTTVPVKCFRILHDDDDDDGG